MLSKAELMLIMWELSKQLNRQPVKVRVRYTVSRSDGMQHNTRG